MGISGDGDENLLWDRTAMNLCDDEWEMKMKM